MVLPRGAEADVRIADGAPGEESGQTGKLQEPEEHGLTGGSQGDVRQRGARDDGNSGPEGTTGAVDVGEDLRCVPLLGEGAQGARATVDARQADRDDGEQDDDVDEVGEARDAGVLGDHDERRGLDIDEATADEARVGVGDQEPDKGQGQNVEERNAPEHLLDGAGKRLLRRFRLGGGETDQLGAGKGEGGRDEDAAHAGEAVGKGTCTIELAFGACDMAPRMASPTYQGYSSISHQ